MVRRVNVNSLTVLDTFLGEEATADAVHRLEPRRLEELGELVTESAAVSLTEAVPPNTYYLGGWFAANWPTGALDEDACLALLYYPHLLLHDGIADFFSPLWDEVPEGRALRTRSGSMEIQGGPKLWGRSGSWLGLRDTLAQAGQQLAWLVDSLRPIRPLLDANVVSLRSQLPTLISQRRAIDASVRNDVRDSAMMRAVLRSRSNGGDSLPIWDTLRGFNIAPSEPLRASDAPWLNQYEYYFLAKTLAVADASGAEYAPMVANDRSLLRAKLETSAPRNVDPINADVLRAVASVVVPNMRMNASLAVEIRQSEESFDHWRRKVRSLSRQTIGAGDSLDEAVRDELLPIVREVEGAVDTGGLARQAATDEVREFVFSGLPTAAVAGAVEGGAGAAIAAGSLAATGVLRWLYSAYRAPLLSGERAVLAHLVKAT